MRKGEEDQGAKLIRYTLGVLLGGVAALALIVLYLRRRIRGAKVTASV